MVLPTASQSPFVAKSSNGMCSLITSLPALLLVVESVLTSRALRGERWYEIASDSVSPTDLTDVAHATPVSLLEPLPSASGFAARYRAALYPVSSPFDLRCAPARIDDFLDRLSKFGDVSKAVMLIALIYLDRFLADEPQIILTTLNVYKLYGVAFMLAAKWHDDDQYNPTLLAQLVGVPCKELGKLERVFLKAMSCRLFVTPEQMLEAQHVFIADAIHASGNMTAYHQLRRLRIIGVEEALEICPSIFIVPMPHIFARVREEIRASLNASDAAGLSTFSSPASYASSSPFSSVFSTVEDLDNSPISAIARVQLLHDFPRSLVPPHLFHDFPEEEVASVVRSDVVWIRDAEAMFSRDSLRRRDQLVSLALGNDVETLIPPLQYRQAPADYFMHALPVDVSATIHGQSWDDVRHGFGMADQFRLHQHARHDIMELERELLDSSPIDSLMTDDDNDSLGGKTWSVPDWQGEMDFFAGVEDLDSDEEDENDEEDVTADVTEEMRVGMGISDDILETPKMCCRMGNCRCKPDVSGWGNPASVERAVGGDAAQRVSALMDPNGVKTGASNPFGHQVGPVPHRFSEMRRSWVAAPAPTAPAPTAAVAAASSSNAAANSNMAATRTEMDTPDYGTLGGIFGMPSIWSMNQP